MKLEIELAGASHIIETPRVERNFACTIDGYSVEADAIEIAPGIYSILISGLSFEARVERFGEDLRISIGGKQYAMRVSDPRKWRRNQNAASASDHKQNVVAPMPGRVVRVLVSAGGTVNVGQGIVVVEAMKMQNEVRSPKTGTIERLLVKEGQPINAGETIAVIA
jgi:biotin carboxyl carrier protein